MKALVTGSGGFLGKRAMLALAKVFKGEVVCIVRSSKDESVVLGIIKEEGLNNASVIVGDLNLPDFVAEALEGVDTLVHIASSTTGATADMFMNTCVGTKALLERAVQAGVKKCVLISSMGVYGWSGLPRGEMITEETPLEENPQLRDPYSYVKLEQEKLTREICTTAGMHLVVVRPGVIYGPGGGALSSRIGVRLGKLFLFMGNGNLLPLTYVDNCAELIALCACDSRADGQVLNVVDDELVTCRKYLRLYCRHVERLFCVPMPYWATMLASRMNEWYFRRSGGQLPCLFSVYKTKSAWRGFRFSNRKAKEVLGWKPRVGFKDGWEQTCRYLKTNLKGSKSNG